MNERNTIGCLHPYWIEQVHVSLTNNEDAKHPSRAIDSFASIAQLVEQRTENPCVAGSIPARGIKASAVALAFFLNILYPF